MNWKLWVVTVWFSALIEITRSQTCRMEIRDPRWRHQWYLKRTTRYRYDMNVMPAWESCVNGTGIKVAVVDKGVDQSHEDLYNQYNSQRGEYSYNRSRGPVLYNGILDQDRLKHGTRVAGIIGAKKNVNGIIGIAFGAEIRDIQIASTSVFESFDEGKLLNRTIDVFSCSFANFHTGTKTYPLSAIQENVFINGTRDGRDRRGSVYVFATGNSGGDESSIFTDSCAYDRLVTNRYVISVAGIQHDLQKLPNGEACSAMMVAAFTAKGGERTHTIVTTDVGNQYTYNFNQNSAAAPMVSGAVALALSANPNLTYRDVMHLIVETSRSNLHESSFQSTFIRNAANFLVSSYFGFGLLDIGALVERSKTWNNVPPRIECSKTVQFNAPLQQNNNDFNLQVASCSATYIEHVEVTLKVNHENAGRIQWVLASPYGTRSKILPGRALDTTKNMNITVLTVQMWGENPNGFWNLKPTPVFERKLDDGLLQSVEIKVHGYRCSAGKCLPPARQESGTWSVWGSWSQCSTSCGTGIRSRQRTCAGINNSVCEGSNIQALSCQQIPCERETPPEREKENLGVWSRWSRCSKTCGIGLKSRSRTTNCRPWEECVNDVETKECYLPNCQDEIYQPGTWSQWGSWTQCSRSCGLGSKYRRRTCNNVSCPGAGIQQQHCQQRFCPNQRTESGTWSLWGRWSQCSSSCGTGIRRRRRTCGGIYCEGSDIQTLSCQQNPCPIETPQERERERFDVWSSWSNCSTTCGPGIRTRSRQHNCRTREMCTDEVQRRQCYPRRCQYEINHNSCTRSVNEDDRRWCGRGHWVKRWYFSQQYRKCMFFWFGWCGDSRNYFNSKEQCRQTCIRY